MLKKGPLTLTPRSRTTPPMTICGKAGKQASLNTTGVVQVASWKRVVAKKPGTQ
jgi:hypothetical protein